MGVSIPVTSKEEAVAVAVAAHRSPSQGFTVGVAEVAVPRELARHRSQEETEPTVLRYSTK